MELRLTKVEVVTEVIQKGGRCPSSVSTHGRSSSALGDSLKERKSSSSFKSIRSEHFQEVNFSEATVEESPGMKHKVSPSEAYELKGEKDGTGGYENGGLDLSEEVTDPVAKKTPFSAASAGLVMRGSSVMREITEGVAKDENKTKEVSREAKKYVVAENEAKSIKVKGATGTTEEPDLQDKTEEEKKDTSANKNQETEETDQAQQQKASELTRSETVVTSSSVPSTSYTIGSFQGLCTSNGDGKDDDTLLIDDRGRYSSSTLSQETTAEGHVQLKPFKLPPGLTDTSYRTYRKIQRQGVKSGRCMLMTMVVLTFVVTMVLAVLILVAPQSMKEKNTSAVTPMPNTTSASTPLSSLFLKNPP